MLKMPQNILFESPTLRHPKDCHHRPVASRTCLRCNQQSFRRRSRLPLHLVYSLLALMPSAMKQEQNSTCMIVHMRITKRNVFLYRGAEAQAKLTLIETFVLHRSHTRYLTVPSEPGSATHFPLAT